MRSSCDFLLTTDLVRRSPGTKAGPKLEALIFYISMPVHLLVPHAANSIIILAEFIHIPSVDVDGGCQFWDQQHMLLYAVIIFLSIVMSNIASVYSWHRPYLAKLPRCQFPPLNIVKVAKISCFFNPCGITSWRHCNDGNWIRWIIPKWPYDNSCCQVITNLIFRSVLLF